MTPTRFRQAGLSLVELMISMTLGLIILSGVLVVFVNTSTARNEVERTARQIENGRYASEILTEDLRLAGFYGELDVWSKADTPGGLPANPCSLAIGDWKAAMRVHLQGFDDSGFVSADCALTNLKPNTDVLVVRRARACVAGSPGCDVAVASKPYLQVALCDSQQASSCSDATTCKGAYTIGVEGTTTFDRLKKGCVGGALAEKRQYLVRIYFVATDNGQGQNIPTLKRLELTGDGTNPRWELVPLVEGIEEFQVHYGLDENNDGVPDRYIANPSNYPVGACTGTCPLDNWLKVYTVRFHVLARNLETSPNYADGKTYNFGNDVNGNPITRTFTGADAAYRRHMYSGLVRIVNPASRKDTP